MQLRGPCPVHGSTSPRSRSLAAHVDKQCWHCFRCGAGGNALDLYVAVTKLPLYAAAVELCARLHRPVPWLQRSASVPLASTARERDACSTEQARSPP
jgi:DNA primase